MRPSLLLACVLLTACGPTARVQVARHLVCSETGTDCRTVETSTYTPTATGRFWDIFLILLASR